MLVLTRKNGDVVRIGKDIEVRVIKIKGGRIQLGIAAPPDVKVLRGELKREQKRKAG